MSEDWTALVYTSFDDRICAAWARGYVDTIEAFEDGDWREARDGEIEYIGNTYTVFEPDEPVVAVRKDGGYAASKLRQLESL